MLDRKSIKSAFESMLFIWGQPLPAKDAADTLDISKKDAIELFNELMEEYEKEDRGIRIRRINESYQFITNPENADAVKRLCTPVKIKSVGRPILYATTDMFLKNFGFEDLSELPEIEDLESVMEVDEDYEEEPDSGQLSIDMSGSGSMGESDE